MNGKEIKKPDWGKLQERLAYRRMQIQRELPKLHKKIETAISDGRWELKVKEFQVFRSSAEKFYQNCCESILMHSDDLMEFDFSISEFLSPNGADNVKVGKICSKKYGEIIFIAEQDEINFNFEFNVIVTRYGLNHQLGTRLRSKRLAQEYTPLTIKHCSEWNSYILSNEKAELLLYGSIMHLISVIPLFRNCDFQFCILGERPSDDAYPPTQGEQPKEL